MKKIFYIILIGIVFINTWSCSDDEDKVIVDGVVEAPILLEITDTSIFLDENYTQTPALTLVWEDSDYGVETQIGYDIQFSSDAEFTNPTMVATTNYRTYTWLTKDLNATVQSIGLAPNEEGMLYVRVLSSLGSVSAYEVVSNAISFGVTPYSSYNFTDLYLVGNATAPGWTPNANNPALYRNPENEFEFHYTGYFENLNPGDINEGRFKVLETDEWQPQWGDARDEGSDPVITSGSVAGNPGTQSGDPGRFGVPASGYYTFTINLDELTYSVVEYDTTGATTYATIGLIGDAAGGWSDDVNMTPLATDPHIWYINDITLANGEAKFRADDAWDVSWGNTTTYAGTGTLGGENIPVVSGTYNVWFNDLTGDYMMIPVQE